MINLRQKIYPTILSCMILILLNQGCNGTGTGNPTIYAKDDTQSHVSALPDSILETNGIQPDHSNLTDDLTYSESIDGSINYPDIFRPIEEMLIVSGANRGLQIVSLPIEGVPALEGTILVPGKHREISLIEDKGYLLTSNSVHVIDIMDKRNPFIDANISVSENIFKIIPYGSELVRLSSNIEGHTQIDVVSEQQLDQPVITGLILPVRVNAAKQHNSQLWVVGNPLTDSETCLIGIDLEELRIMTELEDLSEMACDPLGTGIQDEPTSTVLSITHVKPFTNPTMDLSLSRPSFSNTLQMQYGIWMDIPLYIVIADGSLYLYDLSQGGALASVISITYQPESFVISDTNISFSYLRTTDGPEGSDPTKNYAMFYFRSYDLTDPANPIESREINIPGMLLSLKNDQIFTLDFTWSDEGGIIESLKQSRIDDGSVIVNSDYPLANRTTHRFVWGLNVIILLEGDAGSWGELIQIIDFTQPEHPIKIG